MGTQVASQQSHPGNGLSRGPRASLGMGGGMGGIRRGKQNRSKSLVVAQETQVERVLGRATP